jgi:glycosyltransferase involved in cell wall biosynthesis
MRQAILNFAPDIIHSHDWLGRTLVPVNVLRRRPVIHTLHYYTQSCAKKNLNWHDSVCSGPGLAKCTTCAARHYGHVRGPIIAWANFAWSRVERHQADRLIAVSESVARGNGISLTDRRCVVIPNFLAPHATRPGTYDAYLDRLPAEPFILFVGDLTRQKGINILLEAFRQTDGSVPLVLIGARDAAGVNDLPPGVFALGEWPNEAVRLAYERCLFGVVPSAGLEPFGIVLLESMAAGKPVIAGRIGGIPEVVQDGETGMLVPPFDPAALGDAMTDLVRNNARRAEMGSRAKVCSRSYTADAIIPRIEAIYQEAISARSVADRA